MIGLSPGIYPRELDVSMYVPEESTSVFGVISTASKGPTDEATLITDEGSLIATFGKPSVNHLGIYAAIAYFKNGKQLWFVRVADYDITAEIDLEDDLDAVHGAWQAVSSGSWGNNISVVVSAGTDTDTWKIVVKNNGIVMESYDRILVGADNTADQNYITTRINAISDYITITLTTIPEELDTGTFTLVGGDDGAAVSAADYIGEAGTPPTIPATGMQLLANKETIHVDILAVPGISLDTVIAAGQTICESRGDCMYLPDPRMNLSVKEVVAWTNGTGTSEGDPTSALNSNYLAVYWPWCQVYDQYSASNVWVPPSGFAAGVMANSDYLVGPWSAPAGENRGKLSQVLQTEYSPTPGERDYMATSGNIVNSIVNFYAKGVMIWSQRTGQRLATALNRINVRRMLLYLERVIARAVEPLLFEPNNENTWTLLKDTITPLLSDVAARGGLDGYLVVCDETTNTALVISRNQMRAKIMVEPTKTAEIIILDFVITATGATLEETV